MLGIRKNHTTRNIIMISSAAIMTFSSVAAFGSVMRVSQGVNEQADLEFQLKQQQENHALKVKTEAEKSKAYQKYGLANPSDNFIIKDLSKKNFFKLTKQYKAQIKDFSRSDTDVALVDQYRNVIGWYLPTDDRVCIGSNCRNN